VLQDLLTSQEVLRIEFGIRKEEALMNEQSDQEAEIAELIRLAAVKVR